MSHGNKKWFLRTIQISTYDAVCVRLIAGCDIRAWLKVWFSICFMRFNRIIHIFHQVIWSTVLAIKLPCYVIYYKTVQPWGVLLSYLFHISCHTQESTPAVTSYNISLWQCHQHKDLMRFKALWLPYADNPYHLSNIATIRHSCVFLLSSHALYPTDYAPCDTQLSNVQNLPPR